MEAVRRIVEDAPEEIIVSIPPEWRHRRVQVVLSTLEGSDLMGPTLSYRPTAY